MAKIGVKNIKISKKGLIADSFFDKTGSYPATQIFMRFTEIGFVQDTAVLSDETVTDDNGTYHKITLDFSVRTEYDDNSVLLSKYTGTPIILLVMAVDGNSYVIGDNNAPAYISKRSGYNAMKVREHELSVEYTAIDGLQDYNDILETPSDPGPVVSNELVMVPSSGGSGIIQVESEDEWTIESIS